jgi:hypothetical protein
LNSGADGTVIVTTSGDVALPAEPVLDRPNVEIARLLFIADELPKHEMVENLI